MIPRRSKKLRINSENRSRRIDVYNYNMAKGNPTPTPTVAMAVWDMIKRGFSLSAIQKDLDDLGIDFDVYSIDFVRPNRANFK